MFSHSNVRKVTAHFFIKKTNNLDQQHQSPNPFPLLLISVSCSLSSLSLSLSKRDHRLRRGVHGDGDRGGGRGAHRRGAEPPLRRLQERHRSSPSHVEDHLLDRAEGGEPSERGPRGGHQRLHIQDRVGAQLDLRWDLGAFLIRTSFPRPLRWDLAVYPVVALGIMTAGGVFSGVNPSALASEIRKQVEDSEAKIVVADEVTYDKASPL